MSSKTLEKKSEEIIKAEVISEPFRLKKFIIPFSQFGKPERYIYLGFERIPFRERHPIYQEILKNEFADVIKQFKNIIRQ
ncbi:MAG: hypothetical protein ACFE9Q_11305 [Candidatus Hodarchaeota archaeon]